VTPEPVRRALLIRGAVQGVGFRPFVYRLAGELGLAGWVNNSTRGVTIEVEGDADAVSEFIRRVVDDAPPHARIQAVESSPLPFFGYASFEIRHSEDEGGKTVLVLPDLATCPDCLREVMDPRNRRYRYPFTNCTNCGPRFSIIESLPYDRPNTTMRGFAMCPRCQVEYDSPSDRRFHAQPNACPVCGPHLELWDAGGNDIALGDQALLGAAAAIRNGRIVAVKGLGGFHLMALASDDAAVNELRRRKRREEKPFALMYPSLDALRRDCRVDEQEAALLKSPEAPIVLLRKRDETPDVAPSVAPGNPCLGAMLPYTPLHALLMAEIGGPVVATSGNLSDEPICTDEKEALVRLRGIADLFLVHNRPIVRHVDDSIVRVVAGRPTVLRRARGFAPLPVRLAAEVPTIVACGAHLKNAIAVSVADNVFISQHIGDLETPEAFGAFERVLTDFARLYDLRPVAVACDLHPDYLSSQRARSFGLPVIEVQHHEAHILGCVAEHGLEPPVLGVAWDGTGLGRDGAIWGGEFLRVTADEVARVAHFRPFRLPGGDAAAKEPRRSAAGVLYGILGREWAQREDLVPVKAFPARERRALAQMLERRLNSPLTTSAGRLFDAVSALAGVRQVDRFEGQAAMELEWSIEPAEEAYRFALAEEPEGSLVVDWRPVIEAVIADVASGCGSGLIAARFHNGLAEAVVEVAARVGIPTVVLSGGCFQNAYLLERTVTRLRAAGLTPVWPREVPPNDGGIALGQVAAAARALRKGTHRGAP
jgi:hydrogenase maturation protein HypF